MNINALIVPITELRRRFGELTASLPEIDSLVVTKKGKPFAILKATKETKMEILKKAAGVWKGTALDDDGIWREVFKRKSRKTKIAL